MKKITFKFSMHIENLEDEEEIIPSLKEHLLMWENNADNSVEIEFFSVNDSEELGVKTKKINITFNVNVKHEVFCEKTTFDLYEYLCEWSMNDMGTVE